MASDWNQLMDTLSRIGLTEHEQRVLAAIARKTLGYRKRSDRLPISQLVDATGLDRRHVSRAIERLAGRRLITREGGSRGRGNAATITLNLTPEKSPHDATKKTRPARHISNEEKSPREMSEKSPREAHSIGKGVKHLRRDGFDAYTRAGGDLTLLKERNALAAGITRAATQGHPRELVLAAVTDLGRNREFPGYLAQRIATFKENGIPCRWEGVGRLRLTIAQLNECKCARCTERAKALEHTQQAVTA